MKQRQVQRSLAAGTAALALGVVGLAAQAQPGPPPPPGAPPMNGMRMPMSDADFVRALNVANTSELDEAKFIVNRTKDPAVREFAQHMIDDHSTASVKLEAATRGTNLRPAPRAADETAMSARAIAYLQGEDPAQASNDYMRMQIGAHRRVLGLLQWEMQNGQNAGLKTLATNLMPTVQQHLQLAQQFVVAHNLTPYDPPMANPVPGNVNPNGSANAGPGGPKNNPASTSNGGGSTTGTNNGGGGQVANPVVAPTSAPLGGTGTAAPAASPMPTRSP